MGTYRSGQVSSPHRSHLTCSRQLRRPCRGSLDAVFEILGTIRFFRNPIIEHALIPHQLPAICRGLCNASNSLLHLKGDSAIFPARAATSSLPDFDMTNSRICREWGHHILFSPYRTRTWSQSAPRSTGPSPPSSDATRYGSPRKTSCQVAVAWVPDEARRPAAGRVRPSRP